MNNTEMKKTIESLHRLERRVLPAITSNTTIEEISRATSLTPIETTRAIQWLTKKGAVTQKTETTEMITLGKIGADAAKRGLPERRLLEALADKDIPMPALTRKAELTRDEANAAFGTLRAKGAILLRKDRELVASMSNKGREILREEFEEENFLKKTFPTSIETLTQHEKKIYQALKKRKDFFKTETRKKQIIILEPLGKELINAGVKDDTIVDTITTQIIKTRSWEGKTFRRFDTTAQVPKIRGGKIQMYRSFLDEVRKKFTSLGFTEMTGPIVETEFWNMDALYMPQFHSARDIHDVYQVETPKKIPVDLLVMKRVKAAHEGGTVGSKGWRYNFDTERTQKTILRSQGTACSARMLASPELKIPGKYFGITRVFRKDVIDATHLSDFNQTEGIIIEEGLNMRHLVGLLKMFAKEFAGTEEVRIVPGYFPFTEPSAELFAKHPKLGWVELGGAGIFRPEVVTPLTGRDISVLAWGLGVDRLGMFKLGITDIRQLFSQDLEFLRGTKVI